MERVCHEAGEQTTELIDREYRGPMGGFRCRSVPRTLSITVGALVGLAACGTVDSTSPLDSSAPPGSTTRSDAPGTPTTSSSSVSPSTDVPPSDVVAGDIGDESLVVVDPVDDATRWSVGDAEFASMRSALALDDVVIGFGSDCSGGNVEAAWEPTSGVELWRTEPWRTPASQVPNHGWVRSMQFGEIDGTVALPRPGSVLGVEPSTGTVRWTFTHAPAAVIGIAPTAEVFVVATVDGPGDVVYQGIDPTTGATRWSTTLPVDRFNGAFATGDDIVVVPGFDDAGHVMLALDAGDGSIRWETPAASGSDRRLPDVLESDIVVAMAPDTTAVIGLDPMTGAQLWRLDGSSLPNETAWSVQVGLPRPGALHVESSDGVSLLNPATGEPVWTTTFAELDGQDSWGFGGTTAEGDAVFGGSVADDPTRVRIALLDESRETVWQTQISDVGSIMGDGIATRSDLFLLRRCPGE